MTYDQSTNAAKNFYSAYIAPIVGDAAPVVQAPAATARGRRGATKAPAVRGVSPGVSPGSRSKFAGVDEINNFNNQAAQLGAMLHRWFAPANPPAGSGHADKPPLIMQSAFATRLCGFLGYSFQLTGLAGILTGIAMTINWDFSPTSVINKAASRLATSGNIPAEVASGLTASNVVNICQTLTLLVFAFVLLLSYLSVDIPRTVGCLTQFATVLMLCNVLSDGAMVFGDASGNAIHINTATPGQCPELAKQLGLDPATRGVDMLLDKNSRTTLLHVIQAASKKSEAECTAAESAGALKIQYWQPCTDKCISESTAKHCEPQIDILKALLISKCGDLAPIAIDTQPSKQDHTSDGQDSFEQRLQGVCDVSTLVVKTTCRRKKKDERVNEDVPTHWQAYCAAGMATASAEPCSKQSLSGCAYWQCLSSLEKASPSFWQSSKAKPMQLPPARVRASTPRDYLHYIVAVTVTAGLLYTVLCYLGLMANNSSHTSRGDEQNGIARVVLAVALLSLVLICKACCFAKISLF